MGELKGFGTKVWDLALGFGFHANQLVLIKGYSPPELDKIWLWASYKGSAHAPYFIYLRGTIRLRG